MNQMMDLLLKGYKVFDWTPTYSHFELEKIRGQTVLVWLVKTDPKKEMCPIYA